MQPLTVFYDGECPICDFEVAFYKRRDKCQLITWLDINQLTDGQLPQGKSRSDLLGRFHTIGRDGHWRIGVDAFHAIWQRLPLFCRLAWLFKTPITRQIAHVAYRVFLTWQQRDRRRRQLRKCRNRGDQQSMESVAKPDQP